MKIYSKIICVNGILPTALTVLEFHESNLGVYNLNMLYTIEFTYAIDKETWEYRIIMSFKWYLNQHSKPLPLLNFQFALEPVKEVGTLFEFTKLCHKTYYS